LLMEKCSSGSHNTDLLDQNLTQNYWEKKLNIIPRKVASSSDHHVQSSEPTQKPMITRVNRSSILDRVKNFLPQLEAANKTISNIDPDNRNIECTNNCSDVIEMDIAFVKDLEKTAFCNLMENLPSDSSESEAESDSNINSVCENIQPI